MDSASDIVEDIDIELKAVCYDSTKKKPTGPALKAL
jgi:hypothetical protein